MTRFQAATATVLALTLSLIGVPWLQGVQAQTPTGGGSGASGGSGAVAKVVQKMRSLRSFKADISISSGAGFLRGTLSYQGGKSNFRLGDGRVIAGNGKHLLVYSPATGVAGKQPMTRGGGGLGWVLSGFETKVRGNNAELKAIDPNRGIQKVLMSWSPNYVLRRISIQRKGSEGFLTIRVGRLVAVKNFSVNVFSWRVPAGSRTVENPRDQRN